MDTPDRGHRDVPAVAAATAPVVITVYADFNCPYSYLASQQADLLTRGGRAALDWRAVEHDRTIPVTGGRTTPPPATRADLETLLLPGVELPFPAAVPVSNTLAATAAYAEALSDGCQDELRRLIFGAIWVGAQNLSSAYQVRGLITQAMDWPAALPPSCGTELPRNWHGADDAMIIRRLGGTIAPDGQPVSTAGCERVRNWRREWLALGTPAVPTLIDPDRRVHTGRDALAYLAGLAGPAIEPHPQPGAGQRQPDQRRPDRRQLHPVGAAG